MSHNHQPSTLKMGIPIPNSKLGMWLFLGTEIMFFTAFIGSYIVLRIGSPGWPTDPDDTHIKVFWGGLNTFVLIVSSYCVVIAHEAMAQRNFEKARQYLLYTMALAFVFLGIKSYEYYGKFSHDILPGHIAETPGQSIAKADRELEGVVRERFKRYTDADAVSVPQPDDLGNVNTQLAVFAANKDVDPGLKYLQATASSDVRLYERWLNLHQHVVANASMTAVPRAAGADYLKARTELKEGESFPERQFSEVADEIKRLKSDVDFGGFVSAGVFEMHPLLYGNLFASVYFLMTGFHAIHVLVGMITTFSALKVRID
ncbi:MAG: cytochrome c oxidase subunit 3 [Planctomycetaceae bacterium]